MKEEPNKPNKSDGPQSQPNAQFQSSPILPIAPQPKPSSEAQGKNGAEDEPNNSEIRKELHFLEKINIFGQLGLVVIGIGALCIYGCQLGVMRDTLSLERPWIGPVARTLVFDNSDPAKGHLKALGWHYRNGGRTVATRMRFNLEFKLGPLEPTESTVPVSENCRKGELAGKEGNIAIPGDFDNRTPITVPPEIEKSMDDIYQGKIGLYIVGCIDYSDAARKSWYRTEVLELFLPKNPNFWTPGFGNNAR